MSKAKVKDSIVRLSTITRHGNRLEFFYNSNNNLLVVDLIDASEQGGNELVRKTLDERRLLNHV